VAASFGIELSPAEVYQAFVRAGDSSILPIGVFWEQLPVELGIPAGRHDDFVHAYRQRDVYKQFQLFDDVLDVIAGLGERDLRLGVISNNDEVAERIAELDIQHRFEIVVSPATFGVAKPEPAIFLRALERLRVTPERAIYVGDSYDNDVVGARAAGMTPVLIDRFLINLDGHDAEHRVESLHTLDDLLDRLIHGT
jgi:HAD superfamily hydrolase (TIGR01662 family)